MESMGSRKPRQRSDGGLTTDERRELTELRRENRALGDPSGVRFL